MHSYCSALQTFCLVTFPLLSPLWFVKTPFFNGLSATVRNPVPLPDLYFDSFSYPVAPIVSSAHCLIHSSIICRANYTLSLRSYRLSHWRLTKSVYGRTPDHFLLIVKVYSLIRTALRVVDIALILFVCCFIMLHPRKSRCTITLLPPLKRPPLYNCHFCLSSRWPLWRASTVFFIKDRKC